MGNVWTPTNVGDLRAVALKRRHYPARPGRGNTVGPPCSRLVFIAEGLAGLAVWLTTAPRVVMHRWPGAWVNSLFRNESEHLSSFLIQAAVELTVATWGPLPGMGMITFVDAEATRSRRSRRGLPGACYRAAGWLEIGRTPAGHGRAEKVVLSIGGASHG